MAGNLSQPEPIGILISRRLMLQSAAATSVAAALPGGALAKTAPALDFVSIPLEVTAQDRVADGYEKRVLIRWGDALKPSAPAFDALSLKEAAQEQMFGFNCDYVGYLPLPRGSTSSDHGLLFVNHEYAAQVEMLPAGTPKPAPSADGVALEQAAIGASVLEIRRDGNDWKVVDASTFARRLTVKTPIAVSGPVKGHARLRTAMDPDGDRIIGTLGNCSGGKTPWGTVLTAEENFQNYFRGDTPAGNPEALPHQLSQVTGGTFERATWGLFDRRFDVSQEPNEPNRFGWMVEVDPYDPSSVPVKRTGLGRFRHEAANIVINHDGRIVVYLGEDRVWAYVFRFVSDGKFDPSEGVANGALLDDGTLEVARFETHRLVWIPLQFGTGRLTPENGFHSQKAAGGTPMDKPEDIDSSPLTGHIFVNLTRNNDRKDVHVDASNPRPENEDGHILELVPPRRANGTDHAAGSFQWNVFLLAGPREEGGKYGSADAAILSGPDNLAFDPKGRMWIATDNRRGAYRHGAIPNGLYGCCVNGPSRAVTRFFYNVPAGAEMCGPEFTPDGETLFVAVQHPGEELDPKPNLVWPDFQPGVPGRPSVVAIRRKGGGPIGG